MGIKCIAVNIVSVFSKPSHHFAAVVVLLVIIHMTETVEKPLSESFRMCSWFT